jgi:hypothetical protein
MQGGNLLGISRVRINIETLFSRTKTFIVFWVSKMCTVPTKITCIVGEVYKKK